jgi:alpha-L-rhamnosidase
MKKHDSPAASLAKKLLAWGSAFCLALSLLPAQPTAENAPLAPDAVPVWARGREKEMNLNLGFRGHFAAHAGQNVKLSLTASTLYRVFLNGEFLASGPARAAHGFFRVDEIDLAPRVREGRNILAVEVAGYNANGYGVIDQPSFLLAEVRVNGVPVLATGKDDAFEAFHIKERLQKVERYSFQRAFTEYYRRGADADKWRSDLETRVEKLPLAALPPVKLLPRHVLMPSFEKISPTYFLAAGSIKHVKPKSYYKNRSLTAIGPNLKGFRESKLEVRPTSQEMQEIVTETRDEIVLPFSTFSTKPTPLQAKHFLTYEFGANLSGFIGAKIKCEKPARLVFYFDEILFDGDVNTRQRQRDICNHIVFELSPGTHELETIEAYTLKYLKIIAVEGNATVEDVYIREFARPDDKRASFESGSKKLNEIFYAAKQTSRQNALDIFMDCPSRERAAWLCDSYFAAIMEKDLTGESRISRNFLENYALPERFQHLPDGMIPMCYPADHNNGRFIPQWALWFILHLEDYARNGGDPALVRQIKPRVEKLLQYFARFENSDGLLEKLASWNFVEWSRANSFTKDVNYPTNMLYHAALSRAGDLYGNKTWLEKAAKVKQEVLKQSYNGEFFTDNAVRQNQKLAATKNTTEVCQYYAFYFGVATPETHPALWKKLVSEFGPRRDTKKTYPRVFPANAFMGNYMRIDLLARHGLKKQALAEAEAFFHPMSQQTGTLWEHMGAHSSCNHGFASYIGHVLYRDALGVARIDAEKKEVTLRFDDNGLDACAGSMPVNDTALVLKWKRKEGVIHYTLEAPRGFKVKVEGTLPSVRTP